MQEINARLERVEREVDLLHERASTLSNRIVEVEKSHSVTDVLFANVDRRLGSIEDSLKWIVRLIIGGIISGLIAIMITGGFPGN